MANKREHPEAGAINRPSTVVARFIAPPPQEAETEVLIEDSSSIIDNYDMELPADRFLSPLS